jgi:integrase
MSKRQRNDGLRKICRCSLRSWPRCEHPWYFSYKPKGKPRVRVSLHRYKGEHVALLEDAKTIAAELRTAVANGTYPPRVAEPIEAAPVVTLRIAAERWLATVPLLRGKNQGKPRAGNDAHKVAALCNWTPAGGSEQPLGNYPVAAITEDLYEGFVVSLHEGRQPATVGKFVQMIHALDRWMVKKRHLTVSALTGESAILTVAKSGRRRRRRLVPDTVDAQGRITTEGEERRLLAVAPPSLQRLILAALETACRLGEILELRWSDVDLGHGRITIRGTSNKTGQGRSLPISPRLRGLLELLRTDPTGKDRPGNHHVFGDGIGQRILTPRKAWETAVLKAHGIEPVWTATKSLSPACREALRRIDLHYHDLRHESGSRMLEAGWPLTHVQHMLGHADLKMTAIYLNVNEHGLDESMRRFGTTPWQSVATAPQSRWHAPRALHDRGAPGRRRHGRGVARRGHDPQAQSRAEGVAGRRGRRSRPPRAISA